MPDSNVSSCVLNILGSFSSSLGLYTKLKDRKQKKRRIGRSEKVGEEEQRLSISLRRGPQDIGREYQMSVYTAGDQFAIGDAIAQTSLAEILLRLNVGLVGIITSFLHSERNDVQLDYRGLADLSERCRVDTCRALRQLYKRLTQLKPHKAIMPREEDEVRHGLKAIRDREVDSNKKRNQETSSRAKIRGPTIAQVLIQDSSKPPQIAMVRPGERRKKSRSSSGSGSSSLSKAKSETTLVSSASTPPPEYTAEKPSRPVAQRANTAPDARKPRHKHSTANLLNKSTDNTKSRAAQSTPRLTSTLREPFDPLPPIPNIPELPSTNHAAASTPTLSLPLPRRRKPTPTYYSIASDSTKLGEIPLHKWAVPYDFDQMSVLNREAVRNGWPNEVAQGQEGRRKRGGFLGLFGRRGE